MTGPKPPNVQPKSLSEMNDEELLAHFDKLTAEIDRPPNLDEVVAREEQEEIERKQRLWGNVNTILKNTLVPRKLHVHSWLFSGSTRAGKSVALWSACEAYSS